MEADLIGTLRWIGGALLIAQLAACGGKAVGCPIDAVDCIDDGSDDPARGGAQTASTGFGGSFGLGTVGSGGPGGNGGGPGTSAPSSSGQGQGGQGGGALSGSTPPATGTGGLGSGTTGEGNPTPAGFAGTSSTNDGANSGAAGVSGSGGGSATAPQTAPPCPAVQPTSVTPRPACVTAAPLFPGGSSCTESWCNRPSVPSVVSCNPIQATMGNAYHYTVNGDSYDATFSFDRDLAHSGEYPDPGTLVSVRFAIDVGLTDHGTRIVERVEVPAAVALARGLSFVDHTIVGTLALRANDLDQSHFERPVYESGCSPVLDPAGVATPGACACGFAGIALNIPVYVPFARIP